MGLLPPHVLAVQGETNRSRPQSGRLQSWRHQRKAASTWPPHPSQQRDCFVCVHRAIEKGSRDNISVVVLDLRSYLHATSPRQQSA